MSLSRQQKLTSVLTGSNIYWCFWMWSYEKCCNVIRSCTFSLLITSNSIGIKSWSVLFQSSVVESSFHGCSQTFRSPPKALTQTPLSLHHKRQRWNWEEGRMRNRPKLKGEGGKLRHRRQLAQREAWGFLFIYPRRQFSEMLFLS